MQKIIRDTGLISGWGRFPGGGMVTHSSILAWRIPWTEESDGLRSIGFHRVRHDWSDLACMHAETDQMEPRAAGWELSYWRRQEPWGSWGSLEDSTALAVAGSDNQWLGHWSQSKKRAAFKDSRSPEGASVKPLSSSGSQVGTNGFSPSYYL